MKYYISKYFLLLCVISISCTPFQRVRLQQSIKGSDNYQDYFIGFQLYDPMTGNILAELNSGRYFTPASNTKIITLAAFLDLNSDSIASFKYDRINNILYPLGDPSFLHEDFVIQNSFNQLLKSDSINLASDNKGVTPFGPGWAWDDYNYAYQPERSTLPVYGNVLTIHKKGENLSMIPDFFEPYVNLHSTFNGRAKDHNLFHFAESNYSKDTISRYIPYTTSQEMIGALLTDTLKQNVRWVDARPVRHLETIYNTPALPVLATMMLRSDNFLAEQLLINARLVKGFNTESEYFEYLQNTTFQNLPDPLIIEDGSGLSRYNMNTPRNFVKILENIYFQLSWDEITTIFPNGGVSGTIKNWYGGTTRPYVFAKTGTLRHNHCLSGFIVTDSGRELIFSFMNNHYINGTTEVKEFMQQTLEHIKKSY
ncbi:MAG: D-alanyl-D-alanine carboxypeptidase [Cyclobacteriaceae bacterium]